MCREIAFCSGQRGELEDDEHEQRERHGRGAPPSRRGGASRRAIRYAPGKAKSAYQREPLRDVVARVVADLVREHDPHLVVREAAVEERVPEDDAPRRAEAGGVGVRRVRVVGDVLDVDADWISCPGCRRTRRASALQLGVGGLGRGEVRA